MRGDYVLIDTGGFLGWLIRVGTQSAVNHAVLCTDDSESILEATPNDGVRAAELSEYAGHIEFLSFGQIELTDTQRDEILQRADSLRGVKYGFLDILALSLWSTLHLRFTWLELLVKRQNRQICSQFVAECYSFAGVDLVPGKTPQEVTPGDLLLVLAEK